MEICESKDKKILKIQPGYRMYFGDYAFSGIILAIGWVFQFFFSKLFFLQKKKLLK